MGVDVDLDVDVDVDVEVDVDIDVAILARYLLVATGKITKLLPFFCQGFKFGGINGILMFYDFFGIVEGPP